MHLKWIVGMTVLGIGTGLSGGCGAGPAASQGEPGAGRSSAQTMPAAPSAVRPPSVSPNAASEPPRFVVTQIQHVRVEGRAFLKLNIASTDPDPERSFYPYPLFRVISGGKVVAERDLQTYGLVNEELIPTTLDSLPENFRCVVEMRAHGEMGVPPYEMPYPAPAIKTPTKD